MALYALDFGLDPGVGVERSGFPLSAGLVEVTDPASGEGRPQWLTMLRSGDSIAFRVWDYGFAAGTDLSLVAFRATWVRPSRYNELASPLAAENPLVYSGDQIVAIDDRSQVKSSVFRPARGGWIFGRGESEPLGRTLEIDKATKSAGRYYLSVRIDAVIDGSILRSYHWDPEIVVEGSGGG